MTLWVLSHSQCKVVSSSTQMSMLVWDECSCVPFIQRPRGLNIKCICVHLSAHCHVGFKTRNLFKRSKLTELDKEKSHQTTVFRYNNDYLFHSNVCEWFYCSRWGQNCSRLLRVQSTDCSEKMPVCAVAMLWYKHQEVAIFSHSLALLSFWEAREKRREPNRDFQSEWETVHDSCKLTFLSDIFLPSISGTDDWKISYNVCRFKPDWKLNAIWSRKHFAFAEYLLHLTDKTVRITCRTKL